MGASSVTGVGLGDSQGEFKSWVTAGCGSKGKKPVLCGPFSCAFGSAYHVQCNCPEDDFRSECTVKIKVGGSSTAKTGNRVTRIKVCR